MESIWRRAWRVPIKSMGPHNHQSPLGRSARPIATREIGHHSSSGQAATTRSLKCARCILVPDRAAWWECSSGAALLPRAAMGDAIHTFQQVLLRPGDPPSRFISSAEGVHGGVAQPIGRGMSASEVICSPAAEILCRAPLALYLFSGSVAFALIHPKSIAEYIQRMECAA